MHHCWHFCSSIARRGEPGLCAGDNLRVPPELRIACRKVPVEWELKSLNSSLQFSVKTQICSRQFPARRWLGKGKEQQNRPERECDKWTCGCLGLIAFSHAKVICFCFARMLCMLWQFWHVPGSWHPGVGLALPFVFV